MAKSRSSTLTAFLGLSLGLIAAVSVNNVNGQTTTYERCGTATGGINAQCPVCLNGAYCKATSRPTFRVCEDPTGSTCVHDRITVCPGNYHATVGCAGDVVGTCNWEIPSCT